MQAEEVGRIRKRKDRHTLDLKHTSLLLNSVEAISFQDPRRMATLPSASIRVYFNHKTMQMKLSIYKSTKFTSILLEQDPPPQNRGGFQKSSQHELAGFTDADSSEGQLPE